MSNSFSAWLGQVTTGHGFMIIAPTLLAAFTGMMPWTYAAPLLAAGTIGLAWPENLALQSAGKAATADIVNMVGAYLNNGSGSDPKPLV